MGSHDFLADFVDAAKSQDFDAFVLVGVKGRKTYTASVLSKPEDKAHLHYFVEETLTQAVTDLGRVDAEREQFGKLHKPGCPGDSDDDEIPLGV